MVVFTNVELKYFGLGFRLRGGRVGDGDGDVVDGGGDCDEETGEEGSGVGSENVREVGAVAGGTSGGGREDGGVKGLVTVGAGGLDVGFWCMWKLGTVGAWVVGEGGEV